MGLAISGATIVSVNSTNQVIKDGLIIVESNKISYVGRGNRKLPEGAIVIDGAGKVAMPGMINCHTHAAMTYLRGVAEDRTLMDWLESVVWPTERFLEPYHVYACSLLACLEMIKSGTTTFVDQYFHLDQTYRAVKESGIRAFLAPSIMDNFDVEIGRQVIEQNLHYYHSFHGKADGRVHVMLGPHAPYTCSRQVLCECKRLSDEYDMLIHIHIAEVKNELAKHCPPRRDMLSVEFLDDLNFLGPRVIAAHSIWLSDTDISILKRRGTRVVYNPTSNMKLSAGIPPIVKLLNTGVIVALGTDSAASNNRLDMFEAMKTGALLQKVFTGDPTVLPAETCLRMATIEGARALGAEDKLGSIEVGKLADIILVDFSEPHLKPWHPASSENIISHLVYSARGGDIATVIINGEIVMQDRQVLTLDSKKVINYSQVAAEDILGKAGLIQHHRKGD